MFVVGFVLWTAVAALAFRGNESIAIDGRPAVLEIHASPTVRVRLKSLGTGPWRIRSSTTLRIDDHAEAPLHLDGDRGVELRIAEGRVLIDGRDLGAEVELEGDGPLEVRSSDHPTRRYAGRLSLRPGDLPHPVLSLPLEDYLTQVVPREMPLDYPDAALRAQVIASRSYALWTIGRRKDQAYDVADDETSQVFGDLESRGSRIEGLVRSTRGIVLVWEGKALPAYFSANCGGHTRSNGEAFGESPLQPLRGAVCGSCGWSPHYRWRADLAARELTRALGLEAAPDEARLEQPGSVWEPRIEFLREGRELLSLDARELRRRLGFHRIKSTCIGAVVVGGGRARIEGRGFGHGVGLCQNGARGLAEAGFGPIRILSHYFPGAELARIVP